MANLLDEALREIYKERMGRDPLAFMKDAIDWNAFSPLLEDLYRNNTDKGGAPNIPIVICKCSLNIFQNGPSKIFH